jgi:hypothetical protein
VPGLGPAFPASVNVNLTGTLTGGSDRYNFLGFGNLADLAGKSRGIDLTYDTAPGQRSTAGKNDTLQGGSYFSLASTVTSATVSIGGVTKSVSPGRYRLEIGD